jgi:hypothetical protein
LFWQKVPKNHFPNNSACGFTALLKKSEVGKERRRAALPEMASCHFTPNFSPLLVELKGGKSKAASLGFLLLNLTYRDLYAAEKRSGIRD